MVICLTCSNRHHVHSNTHTYRLKLKKRKIQYLFSPAKKSRWWVRWAVRWGKFSFFLVYLRIHAYLHFDKQTQLPAVLCVTNDKPLTPSTWFSKRQYQGVILQWSHYGWEPQITYSSFTRSFLFDRLSFGRSLRHHRHDHNNKWQTICILVGCCSRCRTALTTE